MSKKWDLKYFQFLSKHFSGSNPAINFFAKKFLTNFLTKKNKAFL